jgi:hypothetical protein
VISNDRPYRDNQLKPGASGYGQVAALRSVEKGRVAATATEGESGQENKFDLSPCYAIPPEP